MNDEILDLPMHPLDPLDDVGDGTIRAYLKALLAALWREGEGFSGKRPFGNSGWQFDVYAALIQAGKVKGKIDPDAGWVDELSKEAEAEADKIILEAIGRL